MLLRYLTFHKLGAVLIEKHIVDDVRPLRRGLKRCGSTGHVPLRRKYRASVHFRRGFSTESAHTGCLRFSRPVIAATSY